MSTRCVVLTGGVGGAKFVLGLSQCLPGPELLAVVNTGDDFSHLGLEISPDLDTLVYTLAGLVNTDTGWGRRDDTWQCLAALAELGGETWFRLGDRDLGTHLVRTAALAAGESLSAVTRRLCRALGVQTRVCPATDAALRTRVHTDAGVLDFQDYFVRRQAAPRVQRLEFAGADAARPAAKVLDALADPGLEVILIAPSNPWLSIAPMLAIPGLATALRAAAAPVVGISPIVGGHALKGPTAKIMTELGLEASAPAVAQHYRGWLDGFILDAQDAAAGDAVRALGLAATHCNTVMNTLDDKRALAMHSLEFAATLRAGRP